MKSGLLWYDNTTAPLAQKIATVNKRYREKFGNAPNCAFVNPTDVSIHDLAALSAETGMSVDVKNTIIKNHIWLGVDPALQMVEQAPAQDDTALLVAAQNSLTQTVVGDYRIANRPDNPNWKGVAHWFDEIAALHSNNETPLVEEIYGGE